MTGRITRARRLIGSAALLIGCAAAPGAVAGEPSLPVAPPVPAVGAPPALIVDPPVMPGAPVAVVRGAGPQPVILFEQPGRLSPPGEPLVLPPPIPRGDRQETLVEAVPESLVVGPGAASQRRLLAFLGAVGRGRFDALHLEVRGGTAAARAAIRTAVRAGVDPGKIRTVAAGGAGVEVVATRYVATAPACPSQAVVGPSVNDNDFEPTLGCSNRANLATMVNDPADLLGNPAVARADGAYAVRGVERYRDGGTRAGRGDGAGSAGAGVPVLPGDGFGFGPPGGSVLGAGGPVSR